MKTADISVEHIDTHGSDLKVVNAARVSFDKQGAWEYAHEEVLVDLEPVQAWTKRLSDRDTKLIRFLAKHGHWTPFGHCTATFRVKAPIFVARQLAKHQVGLVWNEVSRRYVDDEPEFYIAEPRARAANVKQGSAKEAVREADRATDLIKDASKAALWDYQDLLALGVAPEVARCVLPQNTMTSWYWTGSLMAFARVCQLRLDDHSQEETRVVARYISEHLAREFPVSWRALLGHELHDHRQGELPLV
ncbi:THY1 Predicted alternative thymidylate synthase [uncultured Caudovirales phage]|uniref:THY1 Predicted alternative thymidylate synthase n=1 Tax=uncultured Caudovirales phage TaxID=2100421 RepID=A0A6J5NQ81_9CAUD|nr:THY1 Predicted alternative thymidylate synthase [uncultured Caudovirales phage]